MEKHFESFPGFIKIHFIHGYKEIVGPAAGHGWMPGIECESRDGVFHAEEFGVMYPVVPFGGAKRKFHAKIFVTSVSLINIAGFLKLDINLSVGTVKP